MRVKVEREQDIMDEHESRVAHICIFLSLKELSSPAEPIIKAESKELDVLPRHLVDLERSMWKVNAIIGPMVP